MTGWKYYNHSAIPTCAPHEIPDLASIKNGHIWKNVRGEGMLLLARWTTNFDCGYETNWWYVIKDTPFDITALKAKRRYEINKGNKHFEVRRMLKPTDFADELYQVQIEAFSAYPAKYRPIVNKEQFKIDITQWESEKVYIYGAFSREDGRLCGYALIKEEGHVLYFNVLKTCPDREKYGVNAAIVSKILLDFNDKLCELHYICDGTRSILHETAFQDYLEKYFGFRKAYCKLNIEYNPKIKWLILMMFKFRKFFRKFDHIGIVHKMNGVFSMQEMSEAYGC